MHSFFLAETLPYMFMCVIAEFAADARRLFDDRENPISRDDSNAVFTTEGHPILPLPRPTSKTATSRSTRRPGICAVHSPRVDGDSSTHWTELALSPGHRFDADYARTIVGLELDPAQAFRDGTWSIYGECRLAKSEPQTIDILFTTPSVVEDKTPSRDKVEQLSTAVMHVKKSA